MKVWKVKFKERGHGICVRTVTGDLSRQDIIKWYGLTDDEVEWYELTMEERNGTDTCKN